MMQMFLTKFSENPRDSLTKGTKVEYRGKMLKNITKEI